MSVPSGSAVRQVQWLIYVLVALQAASAALSEESNESVMLSLQYRNARDLREMFADVKTLIAHQAQQATDMKTLMARQAHQAQQTSDVKTLIAQQAQQTRDVMARLDSIDNRLDTLETTQSQQARDTMNMLSNELKSLPSWGCEGNKTGLSRILTMDSVITVPCDGQGWIVFQRRVDGAFNFPTRTWDEYKRGFGDKDGSFWLGLETTHRLTSTSPAMLRVELTSFEGEMRYAQYTSFRIEGEEEGYRIHVSGYSGTAEDSLEYHHGKKFSTIDRDQDTSSDHCAEIRLGAWWYGNCYRSNLNSVYRPTGIGPKHQSILWYHWLGQERSYKSVAMKMRLV